MRAVYIAAFALVGVGGCTPFAGGAFSCSDSTSCDKAPGGVCEPTGYCSFPDPACASGRRYGSASGTLGGTCVGDEPVAIDAAMGDAKQPDANDAHVPMWTTIETLAVPVDGTVVTSATTLAAGVDYRLRASGTWVIQSPQGTGADAEWWDFTVMNDGVAGVDVGLAIDDTTVDTNRTPKWGAYTATHVYEVPWMGSGGTITAQIHDGNYANNSGTQTLEILALQ